MTWYSRPPTRPNGTAQIAMSETCPRTPPRAGQRRSPIQMATTTPEDDAQRVAADRQRAEVPHALAGAGDEERGHVAGTLSSRIAVRSSASWPGWSLRPDVRRRAVRLQPHHLGAVRDVVPTGGELVALLDGDVVGLARPHDRGQRTGQPLEGRVEAVEVGRSTDAVSRRGSVVTNTTPTCLRWAGSSRTSADARFAITTWHTSGQWVYPKNTSVSGFSVSVARSYDDPPVSRSATSGDR